MAEISFIIVDNGSDIDILEECDKLHHAFLQLRQKDNADLLAYGMTFDYYKNGNIYRSDIKVPKDKFGIANKLFGLKLIKAELEK